MPLGTIGHTVDLSRPEAHMADKRTYEIHFKLNDQKEAYVVVKASNESEAIGIAADKQDQPIEVTLVLSR